MWVMMHVKIVVGHIGAIVLVQGYIELPKLLKGVFVLFHISILLTLFPIIII